MRTIDRLTKSGFLPYQKWMKRKEISVAENGKTYLLILNPAKYSAVYQIDGEIITDGQKCDKLVTVGNEYSGSDRRCAIIFVELKGKNISHAISQLESTLNHSLFKDNITANDTVRARIVTCGCGPTSSANKIVTEAKVRFLTKYHCDLRILKSRQPDSAI